MCHKEIIVHGLEKIYYHSFVFWHCKYFIWTSSLSNKGRVMSFCVNIEFQLFRVDSLTYEQVTDICFDYV